MRRKKTNFTLIELLVVVAIIAVLIAILLPALSSARESAKSAACTSNLRSIGQATFLYLEDNNGWFPCEYNHYPFSGRWKNHLARYSAAEVDHNGYILNYSKTIFSCPAGSNPHYRDYRVAYRSKSQYHWGIIGYDYDEDVGISDRIDSIDLPLSNVAWVVDGDSLIGSSGYVYQSSFTIDVSYRHNNNTNVLWLDWHVGSYDYIEKKIFTSRESELN